SILPESFRGICSLPETSLGIATMRLKNDVAIITGAGRGIGSTIAKRFVAEGARVVVADLNEGSANRVADEINAAGGTAIALHVDVAEPTSVEQMIGETLARFPRVGGP